MTLCCAFSFFMVIFRIFSDFKSVTLQHIKGRQGRSLDFHFSHQAIRAWLDKDAIFDLGWHWTRGSFKCPVPAEVEKGMFVRHEWRDFWIVAWCLWWATTVKSQGMLNRITERGSGDFTLWPPRRKKNCKCLLYSLENSSHFAATVEVQVRLLVSLLYAVT